MNCHVVRWLKFLENRIYCCALEDVDHIFPSVNKDGQNVRRGSPISHDTIQVWITEWATAVGIEGNGTHFTTHCFRRGGAQYRFMYAPIGLRWSLAVIRWWGVGHLVNMWVFLFVSLQILDKVDWNELQRDTLIKYLLDELHAYEERHSDALRPLGKEADISLLAEHRLTRPITHNDVRELFNTFNVKLSANIDTKLEQHTQKVLALVSQHFQQAHISSASSSSSALPVVSGSGTQAAAPNPSTSTACLPPVTYTPHPGTTSPQPGDAPFYLQIPAIPSSVAQEEKWIWWIRDWDQADPARGLNVALSEWKREWMRGTASAKRQVSNLYNHRKALAVEFIDVWVIFFLWFDFNW